MILNCLKNWEVYQNWEVYRSKTIYKWMVCVRPGSSKQ